MGHPWTGCYGKCNGKNADMNSHCKTSDVPRSAVDHPVLVIIPVEVYIMMARIVGSVLLLVRYAKILSLPPYDKDRLLNV